MEARDESPTTDSDPYDSPLNFDALELELTLRGWTWANLSEATGIHRDTFRKIRLAGGHCRQQTKSRIARALIDHPRAPAEVLAVLGVSQP